jgi:hypothetical protein
VWNRPEHVLIIAIVILLLIGGRKINPRKPPTHPLPASSPIETSRTPAPPKEKPRHAVVGCVRLRRQSR